MTATLARRSQPDGAFASLGVRNFRLYSWGQLVSGSGNWLTSLALTLLVLQRTHSGVAVGLLSACQYGPVLLLSARAGLTVDRSDTRALLITTQSLEMLQSVALAGLALWAGSPTWAFFAAAVAGGCLLAVDQPARRSFVSELVSDGRAANAVTLSSAMSNAARLVGPALAGLLIATVGFGACFAVDAASYLVVLACLDAIDPAELRSPTPTAATGTGQLRAGIGSVLRSATLRPTFVALALIGTLSINYTITLPLFATESLHRGPGAGGTLFACFSAGSLVAALVMARRTSLPPLAVVRGAFGLGMAMLALSAAPSFGWALLLAVAVGAGNVVFMTAATAIAQLRADRHVVGRVLALQGVLISGTTPIGGTMLGALASLTGGRIPLVVGGVAALAAAAYAAVAFGADSRGRG